MHGETLLRIRQYKCNIPKIVPLPSSAMLFNHLVAAFLPLLPPPPPTPTPAFCPYQERTHHLTFRDPPSTQTNKRPTASTLLAADPCSHSLRTAGLHELFLTLCSKMLNAHISWTASSTLQHTHYITFVHPFFSAVASYVQQTMFFGGSLFSPLDPPPPSSVPCLLYLFPPGLLCPPPLFAWRGDEYTKGKSGVACAQVFLCSRSIERQSREPLRPCANTTVRRCFRAF